MKQILHSLCTPFLFLFFTTLYVYNMSLFLVAGLLNRWQRASSARCLQNKARVLTTSRTSKPLFPDSVDVMASEIEVSQRRALRQHSCKTLVPLFCNFIAVEIEVSQRYTLPGFVDVITEEIEVSQCCALPQNSCNPH